MIYRTCAWLILAVTASTLCAQANDHDRVAIPGTMLTVNLADIGLQTNAAGSLAVIET